jgi:hypothetical protein
VDANQSDELGVIIFGGVFCHFRRHQNGTTIQIGVPLLREIWKRAKGKG